MIRLLRPQPRSNPMMMVMKRGKTAPTWAELAQQIDSHVVVIGVDNLATIVVPKGQGTP